MTMENVPFVTVDMERGRIDVHNASHLGPRLQCSRFRLDRDRKVWRQGFRNEAELLPILSWLISQRVALHEDVALKPKHLELLKPCLMVHFDTEGTETRAVIEEIT
jgi:hypothetical protein